MDGVLSGWRIHGALYNLVKSFWSQVNSIDAAKESIWGDSRRQLAKELPSVFKGTELQ